MKRKLGGNVVGSHQVIESRSLDWTTVSRSRASEKGRCEIIGQRSCEASTGGGGERSWRRGRSRSGSEMGSETTRRGDKGRRGDRVRDWEIAAAADDETIERQGRRRRRRRRRRRKTTAATRCSGLEGVQSSDRGRRRFGRQDNRRESQEATAVWR